MLRAIGAGSLTGIVKACHMIFIHPMWDSEGQRLGMKACTPVGYLFRSIGDLIGFSGLIMLFVIPGYLGLQSFRHRFSTHDLWLLLAPLIVGILGRVVFEIGWRMAAKKHYKYDYSTRTVTWTERGCEKAFAFNPKALTSR